MHERKPERPASETFDQAPVIPDLTHEAEVSVESMEVFTRMNLPLHPDLRNMLLETAEHRFIPETLANNRRGSGFMQATRFLADVLRKPADNRVQALFDPKALLEHRQESLERSAEFVDLPESQQQKMRSSWEAQRKARLVLEEAQVQRRHLIEFKTQQKDVRDEAWKMADEYALNEAEAQVYEAEATYEAAIYQTECVYDEVFQEGLPVAYRTAKIDVAKIQEAVASLSREEDRFIGRMIQDLVEPRVGDVQLPRKQEEGYVGTCTTAEQYFLTMLDPVERGYDAPHVLTDSAGEPFMILKNAGEKSALTLKEVVIEGVRLPPGSLLALASKKEWSDIQRIEDCTGFEFLRLTTLAISPGNRTRAFGMAIDFQERNEMYEPRRATIDQLVDYANTQLVRRALSTS